MSATHIIALCAVATVAEAKTEKVTLPEAVQTIDGHGIRQYAPQRPGGPGPDYDASCRESSIVRTSRRDVIEKGAGDWCPEICLLR